MKSTRSSSAEVRHMLSTFPAKFQNSTVGRHVTRIADLLDANGSVAVETVRAALYPHLSLVASRTALRTQLANRMYKNLAGESPLTIAIARKGSAADVIWFEQPARANPAALSSHETRDVSGITLPTNAEAITGSRDLAESQGVLNSSAVAAGLGSLRGVSDGALTKTAATAQKGIHSPATESKRKIVNALDAMVEWANDKRDSALPLLALLGDYGTGKTSHAQTFAKVINRELTHPKHTKTAAFNAALIDLAYLRGIPGLARLSLLDILHVVIRAQGLENKLHAAELLRDARLGATILIYDGLDELVGSHQSHSELADIFRQLMQVFAGDPETGKPSLARVIVSCRTHYFRDFADQHQLFDTRQRGRIKAEDYLCLYLLPWDEKTVAQYLKQRLPANEAKQLRATINDVYDLKSLASRPVLLAMMCEQVGTLMREKSNRNAITAAALYSETVARWVHRDNAKHVLQATHKPVLMGALATALWSAGDESWTSEKLDRWVRVNVDRLFPNSYAADKTEAIQDDLRTATFIVRSGVDGFTFAHRSFMEFFLARQLVTLLDRDDFPEATLATLLPARRLNRETVAFVVELLAAQPARLEARYARLWQWLSNDYGDEAAPAPSAHDALFHLAIAASMTAAANAKRANLRGLSMLDERWTGQNFPPLDLRGANLRGLRATGCNLAGMWVDGANLSQAVLRDCNTAEAQWRGAERGGMVVRESVMTASARPIPGPWTKPFAATEITAVAISPDGKWALTGEFDGSAHLWDVATGREVRVFSGHSNPILSVAFSADGKLVLTESDDASRSADASTRSDVPLLSSDGLGSRRVTRVKARRDEYFLVSRSGTCYGRRSAATVDPEMPADREFNFRMLPVVSPDGNTTISPGIYTAPHLLDIATGREVQTLSGHQHWVTSVAFSPDGQTLLTGSLDHSARIWDTNKGREIKVLTGHGNWVTSVDISLDGKSVFIECDEGAARLWDVATGRELKTKAFVPHASPNPTDACESATATIEQGVAVIRTTAGPRAGQVRYIVVGEQPSTACFDANGALIDFDDEAADTWLYWLGNGTPQPVEAALLASE